MNHVSPGAVPARGRPGHGIVRAVAAAPAAHLRRCLRDRDGRLVSSLTETHGSRGSRPDTVGPARTVPSAGKDHSLTTHHLVTVWAPSRGPDPLQAHLQLLLDLRRRERAGELEDEDVYVWWGKIRSPNRQQPLPHLDQILALDEVLRGDQGPDAEIHLYLTDYRSLYV